MSELYAVLTGDLVNSSSLSPIELNTARDRLKQASDELNHWENRTLRGKIDFFRGDAWQLLLAKPKWAMRCAVYLRASLLSQGMVDTRIAVGIGEVDSISRKRTSLSIGESFTLSGQALDSLPRRLRFTITLSPQSGHLAGWVAIAARLCDALIVHWTARQAEVVLGMLRGLTQEEVANQLDPPISQPTANKALIGADWHALEPALKHFESFDWRTGWM